MPPSFYNHSSGPYHFLASSPPPALSTGHSRPASRANRTLRFAQLSPDDVYVYESAPPSPRKKALPLPPPPDVPDPSIISLGQWKGTLPNSEPDTSASTVPRIVTDTVEDAEMEEGTPEYIRRRYFPNAPAHDPNLAWMKPTTSSDPNPTSSSVRFDLTGTPIPASLASTLPTHLGLHHHADGQHAGYTLDDIFLLSRSTVPSQRTTMLTVLARITCKLGSLKRGNDEGSISELRDQADQLRGKILAAGLEALNERGTLAVSAVDVLWECIVGWDGDIPEFNEPEVASIPDATAISTLPLDYLLPQITRLFETATLPPESLTQWLSIVHRLAQYSNKMASSIVSTPGLVAAILYAFLLKPIPPTQTSTLPEPLAIETLTTLAISSRDSAQALLQPADTLLRFVVILPNASTYPLPLMTRLSASTLRFYSVLASYGLYSHIATTASAQFLDLHRYVMSPECTSRQLMSAWARLLEAWIVCATNPHRTSPTHDILWSQVVGWGWGEGVLELRNKLGVEDRDWPVWTAVWNAEAAWLEGSRVNGVTGGQGERTVAIESFKDGFESGKEKMTVSGSVKNLQRELDHLRSKEGGPLRREDIDGISQGLTVASAIRLWLACVPSPSEESNLTSPPFLLPFNELSGLCASLVIHPLWLFPYASQASRRPLTSLLPSFLRLSRCVPSTSDDLWIAQALAILSRLVGGDEEFGERALEDMLKMITSEFMSSRAMHAPPTFWDRGGFSIIMPFLLDNLRQEEGAYVGPLSPTPRSILLATTQRVPFRGVSDRVGKLGLPLKRDWMLSPVDHLLQSGTSAVLTSLPRSWDASEPELVRATLLLVKVTRAILLYHSLHPFILTRAETVWACMKVIMLEHGQTHNTSAEEVFRDDSVSQLMDDLLAPFTVSSQSSENPIEPDDLEKLAAHFLGPSTPFYQYYTDFVALYDAISFSHPLFSRLLLPPTSMRYAVDYRMYLWNDYGHILKTIRVPTEQVITSSLTEYLWPIETNVEMISAYLRGLLKGPLDGFLRFVAVHHVACNIWADLRTEEADETRAYKLLSAVVTQGSIQAIKEVVLYCQPNQAGSLVPPECFEQRGAWISSRMDAIKKWGDLKFVERISGLLQTS
jgi:hypothetical protein